jgi:NHL repeat
MIKHLKIVIAAAAGLLMAFTGLQRPKAEVWMVSTYAGYSDAGVSKDGRGRAAQFTNYTGRQTTDAQGNIYVLDQGALRKVDTGSNVTTLFGGGVLDAEGNMQSLPKTPGANGICADKNGNIYLSNNGAHMIYRVKPGRTVEKYAGDDGYKGNSDGPALQAGFNSPEGLCIDKAGNIYVADSYNFCIRKISADGKTVSTLAGSEGDFKPGTGKAAKILVARVIAADSKGNIYLAQNGRGSCVAKITPSGVVTNFAGDIDVITPSSGNTDGTGKAARFYRINALAVDNEDNRKLPGTQGHPGGCGYHPGRRKRSAVARCCRRKSPVWHD